MSEINGERLERIKNMQSIYHVGTEDGVGEDEVDWLIEQAERMKELEKNLQNHENTISYAYKELESIQTENARLRESLKEISEIKGYFQNDVFQGIARQALDKPT